MIHRRGVREVFAATTIDHRLRESGPQGGQGEHVIHVGMRDKNAFHLQSVFRHRGQGRGGIGSGVENGGGFGGRIEDDEVIHRHVEFGIMGIEMQQAGDFHRGGRPRLAGDREEGFRVEIQQRCHLP